MIKLLVLIIMLFWYLVLSIHNVVLLNKIDKAVKYLKKKLYEEAPLLVEYEIETLLDILKGEK